ncbi:MAG: hypothetical protein HC929_21855 [Leptolyngbyaceae cyanobacterium SM2_5_2]|nr:hypothetical protein [Leptolyngbyaceae cyanobacterium SM2_5_2]
MTSSPFLTQVEPHRDPKALWPLAAIASLLTHGLLLLGFRPLLIAAQTPTPSNATIPIQLITADTASEPATLAASQSAPIDNATASQPAAPSSTPAPTDSAAPSSSAQPSTSLPAAPPDFGAQSAPNPQTYAPSPPGPNLAQPAPAVLPPPGELSAPSPPPPSVTAPPSDLSTPPEFSPPAEFNPPVPSTASPSRDTAAGGQLTPLGIQPAAYGRDFPDTPPQLLSNASLSVQPWLSVCGWQNPGALVSPGLSATVQLQIYVQPSGEISSRGWLVVAVTPPLMTWLAALYSVSCACNPLC